MKHIRELLDIGCGLDACIIGGGPSAAGFDWGSIPSEMIRIEINYPNAETEIDYQMYYDEGPNKFWDDQDNAGRVKIGFKTWAKNADYYYEFNDFDFGDMGYHALQFADKIFNFKNIYLIGYDYKTDGATYHYWEDSSDEEALSRFKKHSIQTVLPKYSTMNWKNKIYNTNDKSAITAFEYKPIKEKCYV